MLTSQQRKQLAGIDTALESHGTVCVVYYTNITIAFLENERRDHHADVLSIEKDIETFGIKQSGHFMIEMFRRRWVHGVALRSPRDTRDLAFGAFVAKARLLKHLESRSNTWKTRMEPAPYDATPDDGCVTKYVSRDPTRASSSTVA